LAFFFIFHFTYLYILSHKVDDANKKITIILIVRRKQLRTAMSKAIFYILRSNNGCYNTNYSWLNLPYWLYQDFSLILSKIQTNFAVSSVNL